MMLKTKLTFFFGLPLITFGLLANSALALSAETLFPAGGALPVTEKSSVREAPVCGTKIPLAAGITAAGASLTLAPGSTCQTDTSQSDFQTGTAANTDLTSSPGDVNLALASAETADQVSNPAALSTTNNLSATTWTGQTFRAGATGNLTKLIVGLGLASGTSGTITVEIRDVSGTNPGTTVLATGTAGPVTNVGSAALYTVTFAAPAAVTSGQSYSIVLSRSVGNTVFGVRGSTAGGSTLTNGQVFTTTNSGTTWTAIAADLYFTTYVTAPAYSSSGNFVSGTKDSNPAAGELTSWGSISWNASLPGGTSLQFQAAGSNNANGPFDFVGPDGTAATFFTTSGASLVNFYGLRYLKYKAYLSTSSGTVTPALNDVTICYDTLAPTAGEASITGRVLKSQGGPIRNARVTLTDNRGNQITVLTNPFGYYHFTGISAGRSYLFSVTAKGHQFTPQLMNVNENLTGLVFIAH